MTTLRLGTRGSVLARTQAGQVADAIAEHGHAVGTVIVRTVGDDHVGPLSELPAPGAFVSALRDALLGGEVDLAVHSAKDLPSAPVDGLVLAAVPVREDPRDALVARDHLVLDALPTGARVGTGSPRRAAALVALRPDLTVVPVRGNVDTRIAKVASGELDALIVALAALRRLGRADEASEVLAPERMLPAPAQGALAVECRAEDTTTAGVLAGLDDRHSHLAVLAERAFLAGLGASCASAVSALARVEGTDLVLTGSVAAPDGRHLRRAGSAALPIDPGALDGTGTTSSPAVIAADGAATASALGHALAQELLTAGAGALMVR